MEGHDQEAQATLRHLFPVLLLLTVVAGGCNSPRPPDRGGGA